MLNMSVIYYKIWRDVWEHKSRTLQVIAIIAVGATAVGIALGSGSLMTQDVTRNWLSSKPATIGLLVEPPVNDDILNTLENLAEVETVVGWHQKNISWRNTPDESWQPGVLIAIDDYEEQELRYVQRLAGDWPHRKLMGVRSDYNLAVGDRVYLNINHDERNAEEVAINGVLYNIASPPPRVNPNVSFFTTSERFEALTGQSGYDLVLASIPDFSPERALAAAELMERELDKQGIEVSPAMPAPGGFQTRTSEPTRFIIQDIIDGIFFVLSIMGVASLFLGLFLIYNTIDATITREINQIGVMKAVGAQTGQIVGIYFSVVLIYTLLALLLAIPLGALGAQGLRAVLIGMMGMTPGPFEFVPKVVAIQAALTLVSPLIMALIPISSGARITVREAISSYGLGGGASTWLERLLAKLESIPRIVSLTISNTFRNTRRVFFTQITLVGAAVLFMMIVNAQSSLSHTFSHILFSIFDSNVMLTLNEPARIKTIERIGLTVPNVKEVEVWTRSHGVARLQDRPESNDDPAVRLRGVPVPTTAYKPHLLAGRWLEPTDTHAIVIAEALADELGADVGDWLTLEIPTRRDSDWQVVGIVYDTIDQQAGMVPQPTLMRHIGEMGQGSDIRVQTFRTDARSEVETATALKTAYEANGFELQVSLEETASQLSQQRIQSMSLFTAILGIMAVLMTVVGTIALSGTLSINVMDRTREIGVMRAIGGTSMYISGQFIGEGIILGWLSWLIALPLGIPAGQIIVIFLSDLIRTELVYQPSLTGPLYWFVIISALAIVASWFPAQRASKMSVRESLTYG